MENKKCCLCDKEAFSITKENKFYCEKCTYELYFQCKGCGNLIKRNTKNKKQYYCEWCKKNVCPHCGKA